MNPTITEDNVSEVVRAYVLSIAPTLRVVRTPVNRAARPEGAYVSFTPGLRRPLCTNVTSGDASTRTVLSPDQMSFQIDCYGDGSADLAKTLNALFRDQYAVDLFKAAGFDIAPLYATDVMQAPFVDESDQYEERYTFEIEVQINAAIVAPQQSCNMLDMVLTSVDATYPPSEGN
jgi:hypothetical protein